MSSSGPPPGPPRPWLPPAKPAEPAASSAPGLAAPPATVEPNAALPEDVRHEFARLRSALLARRVVVMEQDVPALELLAGAIREYHQMRAVVAEEGPVYKTVTEQGSVLFRPRPEVAMGADAWRRALSMLKGFGLLPADASRVAATPPTTAEGKRHRYFGKETPTERLRRMALEGERR